MRIFDAHIYSLLQNIIYMVTKHTYIHIATKHAYICVFVYETRLYLCTSELLVSLAGITNSTQRILIRKQEEKQGGMVSYCRILH